MSEINKPTVRAAQDLTPAELAAIVCAEIQKFERRHLAR